MENNANVFVWGKLGLGEKCSISVHEQIMERINAKRDFFFLFSYFGLESPQHRK
jgi:hypothetical protein